MPTRAPIHRPLWWKPKAAKERQRKALIDQHRPSAPERGYDNAWRALRKRFLQFNPSCCYPGCLSAAEHVDHYLTIAERPDLRLEWRNLRPYCAHHHNQRTAREQGFAKGKSIQR
jgi:5-methylcytosine-specific restriction protein A